MDYITTNIRLPREGYFKAKAEAAKRRKSFSALVREKMGMEEKKFTKEEVAKIMAETRKIAKENAKYTKGFDSVKALREIRYQGKW